MDKQLKEYIEFVQEQVKKYEKYSSITENATEITPQEINTALANYSKVFDMLLSEYYRKKAELKDVEVAYQLWWDDKFCEVRRRLNDTSLPASKWLSKQEIESETRNKYKDDYKEWQYKFFKAEQETNFISRKLEGWKKVDSLLMTISHNMRSELKSLSLSDRLNSNYIDRVREEA